MRKLLLLLILSYAFTLKAQNYTFSKSTGTYSNLTGTTIVANGNWTTIRKGIKIPFILNYWGVDITDSVYLDDWGSISLDDFYDDEMSFLYEDMNSRGAGKSIVSFKVEGTTPSRIFKLEYQNVGFDGDLPGLTDSANVQCWLYETSNIIEFRYGPNKVKLSTWAGSGPYVDIINAAYNKVVSVEGNPANPTITSNVFNMSELNGMPADGTIYKFTPTTVGGINNLSLKINVIQNKISLPASLEVRSINIYNANGQLIQSAISADEIDFSNFAPGLYVIAVDTKEGLLTQKLVL